LQPQSCLAEVSPREEPFELAARIREPVHDDQRLIKGAWIAEVLSTDPWTAVDKNWVASAQTLVIDTIVGDPTTTVRVSCQPEHPDQIYGYVVTGRGRVLHWIYVKPKFRRERIAHRLLLDQFDDFIDPITTTGSSRVVRYYEKRWNLRYRSHILCEIVRGQYRG